MSDKLFDKHKTHTSFIMHTNYKLKYTLNCYYVLNIEWKFNEIHNFKNYGIILPSKWKYTSHFI